MMKLSERLRDYARGRWRIAKWADELAQLEEGNTALKAGINWLRIMAETEYPCSAIAEKATALLAGTQESER